VPLSLSLIHTQLHLLCRHGWITEQAYRAHAQGPKVLRALLDFKCKMSLKLIPTDRKETENDDKETLKDQKEMQRNCAETQNDQNRHKITYKRCKITTKTRKTTIQDIELPKRDAK